MGALHRLWYNQGLYLTDAIKAKFLFLGYISKISGGHLPNDLGSDYITVSGTGEDMTFQVPNTTTYKNANSQDWLWFFYEDTQRTVSFNELVSYDYYRTFVKYNNVYPYEISIIGILKSGVTLTTAESNIVREFFELSIWWDNTLSEYGRLKQNRGIGRSVNQDDRIFTLTAQMVALGESPALGYQDNINRAIKKLKGDNSIGFDYFDILDRLIVYRAVGEGTSKLNWIQNAFNAEAVANGGTITFTTKSGYKTDGTKSYLRSNYNPYLNASKMTQNNVSYGIKVSGTLSTTSAGGYGAYDGAKVLSFYQAVDSVPSIYHRVNSMDYGGPFYVIGYNNLVRINSTSFSMQRTGYSESIATSKNSIGMVNKELYSLCQNSNGTPSGFVKNTEVLEMEWEGAAMTQEQFDIFQNIMNGYIALL